MPIFHRLRKELDVNAIIVIPAYFTPEERAALYGDLSAFTIKEDAHKALYEADFAFICSGTATLEAALIGTPFILSFIAKPLDYFIATKLVKIEYVGLANIMFLKHKQTTMHPEFLQDKVTVANLLQAYKEYDRSTFLENSQTLRNYLKHGSSKNVARMIES